MFPNGEVQYLHPKDGVYPERVNAGRQAVGTNDRSIGKNTNPVKVRPKGCKLKRLSALSCLQSLVICPEAVQGQLSLLKVVWLLFDFEAVWLRGRE